jgi:hypothetical protein
MAPGAFDSIKFETVGFTIVSPLQMVAKQAKTANVPR